MTVNLDYPAGQSNGSSCQVFGGYHHGSTTAAGTPFPYAVVGNCPAVATSYGITALSFLTITASHELIESATDPLALNTLTYAFPGSSTSPWIALGSEVADLCQLLVAGAIESGTSLARIWSNNAASQGLDPCLPAPSGPFADTAGPASIVAVNAGSSAQIPLQGWSSAPVPAWNLSVGQLAQPGQAPLTATIDKSTLNNDQQANLTVNVPQGGAGQLWILIAITDATGNGGDKAFWPIVVAGQ
jgi:hypothetical protein